MALSLLFIELGLQFRGHLVVPILGLFKIDSYLMHVCKSIKILVLVHLNVRWLVVLLEARIHRNDAFLKLLVLSS